MEIDIKYFIAVNVTDTCSLWNVLSSKLLTAASVNAKCFFCMTKFVEYECLIKPRVSMAEAEIQLVKRLRDAIGKKTISTHSLSISDLQEIALLKQRKKLGIGELSSIAFAKRTNQAFLTDDQAARKLAKEILGKERAQTTPHLLGWLFIERHLSDIDLEPLINEHSSFNRPLEKYFREIYNEYLRIRLFD